MRATRIGLSSANLSRRALCRRHVINRVAAVTSAALPDGLPALIAENYGRDRGEASRLFTGTVFTSFLFFTNRTTV